MHQSVAVWLHPQLHVSHSVSVPVCVHVSVCVSVAPHVVCCQCCWYVVDVVVWLSVWVCVIRMWMWMRGRHHLWMCMCTRDACIFCFDVWIGACAIAMWIRWMDTCRGCIDVYVMHVRMHVYVCDVCDGRDVCMRMDVYGRMYCACMVCYVHAVCARIRVP